MENMTYRLEGVLKSSSDDRDFEGPLNLILVLLSKNKIEIRDIQISLILDQYLEQIEKMQSMDLEVAAEFIQMASHLLYLKTRTLLAAEDEEISELDALIASLEQLKSRDAYAGIKQVTGEFDRKTRVGLQYFSRQPEPLPRQQYQYRHEPYELLSAFADMLARGGQSPETVEPLQIVPKKIVYAVRTKSREILSVLQECGTLSLQALFAETASRSELVATFLSVLELCAVGGLTITSSETGFSVALAEGADTQQLLEAMEARDEGEVQDGTT